MRVMLLVWRLLGRKAFTLLLYPVVAVYWLTASTAQAFAELDIAYANSSPSV
jgi:predicted LPLAT superfamily acyltransferase